MAREWIVRGVPGGLSADMWWLSKVSDAAPVGTGGARSGLGDRARGFVAALVLLVALADVLFYGHGPGLSLALFAGAVLVAAMVLHPGGERLRPALLLGATTLPVIEYVQTLSLAFLVLGLLVSLVWAVRGPEVLARGVVALLASVPLRGARDAVALGRSGTVSDVVRDGRRQVRGWAFPVGGALVLIGLLTEANPVLSEALGGLLKLDLGAWEAFTRLLFWTGAALLIWPLIAPPQRVPDRGLPPTGLRLPGLSGGSVARGLVVFNAVLGVQTGLDAAYLWGGADLPDGMTAAEYAHRGAYPLLVTALLAGGFALAARPFAREDRGLWMLLLLWLGQNVALTVSALLRLELYVGAFGLTYLRLHSAIWMGLVAAGLGLTAWQVWRDLPNRWLVLRTAGLGVGTLYVACFWNFAAIIAAENLSRDKVDGAYVCSLGPTAAAAIAQSNSALSCWPRRPQITGWRDWGFRNWRVRRYLDQMAEAGHENTGRG